MLFLTLFLQFVEAHDFHIKLCSCQLTVIRRPGVTSRAGTANPLGAPESTLVF